MNDTNEQSISASRRIEAGHQRLFDLVANPSMHPVIDGSGSVRSSRSTSSKLGPGDRFSIGMRIGIPYLISNKVVEYEEGRLIAWAHFGGWRWRWRFETVDDATLVTETFDWSTTVLKPYVNLLGWPERNRAVLEKSLDRLEAYITNTTGST